MSKAKTWALGTTAFLAVAAGGPITMYYLRPTDEELFAKFNPELKKRNLENRERREREFDEFTTKLKEYAKSDKPIWVVAAEEERKRRAQVGQTMTERLAEENKIREEMKAQQAGLQTGKK